MTEKDIAEMFGELQEIRTSIEKVKDKDLNWFGAHICMLMEEYCRINGYNVVAFVESIYTAVKEVNAFCGEYK